MKRINFTIFNPLKEYGGLEIATTKLGKDLQSRSFGVNLVTLHDSRVEKLAKSLDIPVNHISIRNHYFNFRAALELNNIFSESSTDICIVGKSSLLSTAIIAKKLSKKKPVIIFLQQMQSGLRKNDILHNWIFSNLDAAIVLNNRMKKDLQQSTILNPSKIRIIPYGIDTDNFKPFPEKKIEFRKKFNLPEHNFLIGCIGRIDRQKGQDDLIKAFIALENKTGIKLVIAGDTSDDSFISELKAIKKNIPGDDLIFIPFTDEVPELMNCFDLLVVPSHCETFGLVIIEGMACGLTVIGTDCGGVPEIIDSGKTGFLFQPKNSQELTDIIEMLCNDRAKLNKIGSASREKALNIYNKDLQINDFIKCCFELLSKT